MIYERVTKEAIERSQSDAPGVVRGVLMTQGEADDGHIVNIAGMQAEPPKPICFGHNSYAPEGTLGSWTSFEKGRLAKVAVLRSAGAIELGSGGPQDSLVGVRQGIAKMVDAGHFRGLSGRWEPLDEPERRINLASNHPAFVDATKTNSNDARYWGYYFPTSRLVEGSIVPVGSDAAAEIGRSVRETTGEVRTFWRGVLGGMLARGPITGAMAQAAERFRAAVGELHALNLDDFGTLLRACGETRDPSMFHAVEYGEGKRVLIPREAYDALTRESTHRLEVAFDLLADVTAVGDIAELELLEREVPAEIPQSVPTPVSAAEIQEMFVRVSREVIEAKLGNLGEEMRAMALEEFLRARGTR